ILVAADRKAAGVEEEVVRLAEKHEVLDRLLFIGTTISEPQVRRQLKRASVKARTAAVANNAHEFSKDLAASTVDRVYFRFLPSKEQIEAVQRANKRSFIAGATVSGNLPDNWRQATEAGIDAILTDYPLELRSALKEIAASKN